MGQPNEKLIIASSGHPDQHTDQPPLLNAYTPHVDLRIYPLETFLD